jgi:uncharacterized cupredoxin-like copper-binding protein
MKVGPYRSTTVTLFTAVGLGMAACSSSSSTIGSTEPTETSTAPAVPGQVGVAEKDFEISLTSTSAPAGKITFAVSNDGPSTHEFVVFDTDLAADQLPTDSEGDVDEEGDGVTHVDEIEDIAAGTSDNVLDVDLEAGSYVLICNLPGHYNLGMRTAFTVQ